jgi:hypothetical protein
MTTELITNIANISLALSVIVAVVFGITQFRADARDRHERLTLEALRNFQSREFCELILYVTTSELPASQVEMRKLTANEQIMLIQLGQEMESLGMMVYEKLINIDLVDKTLGSFVIIAWEKYKPMFMNIRVDQPDPFLGEYFQWLAESIDKRMKEQPRQPFYKSPEEKK